MKQLFLHIRKLVRQFVICALEGNEMFAFAGDVAEEILAGVAGGNLGWGSADRDE